AHVGDVGGRVVVGVDRRLEAAGGAGGAQVVGGRGDRVARVVHRAAAVPVEIAAELGPRVAGPPDPDAELHGAGGAGVVPARPHPGQLGAAVVGLDLADRGQPRPGQPRAT